MKKFILKHVIALAALAIAASYGLMSFGVNDRSAHKALSTMEWYEVTPHPSNPDEDEIGDLIPDFTETPECNTNKNSKRCAIQLDLSNATSFPATVEDAEEDSSVEVGDSSFSENQP